MTQELIERLPYIAAILEANADKFAVPDHISAKVRDIRAAADALQSQSARIAELEGALRQIQTGADHGIAQFNERQNGRRSPIWRSVNVLQDNLAACYGTALSALIKVDHGESSLTKDSTSG